MRHDKTNPWNCIFNLENEVRPLALPSGLSLKGECKVEDSHSPRQNKAVAVIRRNRKSAIGNWQYCISPQFEIRIPQ
jgi:hypothetical protein